MPVTDDSVDEAKNLELKTRAVQGEKKKSATTVVAAGS